MSGHIQVPGGRVWYRTLGSRDRHPLIIVHGGPGGAHDYLEPLSALADERQVVFYDQLGSGRSDRPFNTELWKLDRFVEELAQIRESLGLDKFHLFGHSWGSVIVAGYALTQPNGLASLSMAGPCLSMPKWIDDEIHLLNELSEPTRNTIKKG